MAVQEKANTVTASMTLGTDSHLFSSAYPSVTSDTNKRLLIKVSQRTFNPFKLYQIEMRINTGAVGEYSMTSDQNGPVWMSCYFPPPDTRYFVVKSGKFTLDSAATEEEINGRFEGEFEIHDGGPSEPLIIEDGIISYKKSESVLSEGEVIGKVKVGRHPEKDFIATKNITTRVVEPYLEVSASQDAGTAIGMLYLYIPTALLKDGKNELDIYDATDEKGVFAIYLENFSYQGTTGKITFDYNKEKQHFENGTLQFSVENADPQKQLSFTNGTFDIIG